MEGLQSFGSITSQGFSGSIITPFSSSYQSTIQRFSTTCILKPAVIVEPATANDISIALKFALGLTRYHIPVPEIAVKGGGVNSAPGVSSTNNGVVFDLAKMKSAKVSPDKKSITVAGGALWSDVYAEADKQGVVVVGGSVHLVGVGGSTLAAGYSPLSGQYGLAIDNMLSAQVVLASGQVINTDEKHEPDLFWAIRGGVNQFGIVTQMTFATHPFPGPITVGSLGYLGTDLPKVLAALHDHLAHQDPSSKMILMFARSPPDFNPTLLILPYIEEQKTKPDTVLAPFRTLAKPIFESIFTVNNFTSVSHGADSSITNQPPRVTTNGALISDVWDDTVTSVYQEWLKFTEDPEFQATISMWEFSHRDKIASKPAGSTAFAARSPHYYWTVTARHTNPSNDRKVSDWTSNLAKSVRQAQVKKTGKSLPLPASFAQTPQTVSTQDIYGDNLPKLRKLKARYDPSKVWRTGWVIDPDHS